MKRVIVLFGLAVIIGGCANQEKPEEQVEITTETEIALADEIVAETMRSWQAYKTYAWGHDALKPITKSHSDWYEKPLYISPIDAYSTLFLMGLTEETAEIERYVIDSLNFDIDQSAKIFEVNIRILGGLLSMYELSRNEQILAKAQDFADRMLPAFDTETGIPTYWVNLKTGKTSGDTVNVAEAGTYTMEMGVLSYYTNDPKYYQAGKRATKAIFERRSELGLIGDVIDVRTGKWVSTKSHICAGVDSYYEYLYKSYLLFGDEELGDIWRASISGIQDYMAEKVDGKLWYSRVDMHSGKMESSVITLYDAFFPALLALSNDTATAIELQKSWLWLWDKYGIEPMAYDYKRGVATYPVYELNPEIIESAYYLYKITVDSSYVKMNEHFWNSIKTHCKNDIAFTAIENVETMEKRDDMPTFFFAETMKYFYLTFSNQEKYPFDEMIFNTEAHPFFKKHFDKNLAKTYLGFN